MSTQSGDINCSQNSTGMEEIPERLATLAKAGTFGKRTFLKAEPNPDAGAAPNFASQLGFFVLEFENGAETSTELVVTKIQPKSDLERTLQNSDNQFHCEVTMFTKVLPKLCGDKLGLFPKFWYGEASLGKDPRRDIVILEDLKSQGYTCAGEVFLSPEVIRTTLEKLGEFHGLTYRAKMNKEEDVLTLGKSLPSKIFLPDFDLTNTPCLERGFKAVQAERASQVLDDALEKIRRSGSTKLWTEMRLPKEPFATIIHGDFNVNNLMFKLDENGGLIDLKFLDFQTSIYSDPAVDIAFLLYINTSQETRNEHWDSFLRAYWEGVMSTCSSPGFTYEEFLENFSTRALYGYLPCSFFLPVMLDTTKVPLEEVVKLDFESQMKRMVTAGGEKATVALADIVKDLLDRGYLESYLKKF